MSISILQIWQIFHEMQEETYEILIFNLKGWTNKGPKIALLCLVTNQSFIVWSERVTELKVMKGTYKTEIALSFVSKMEVVVTSFYDVHLILSNICFCTFSLKRNIKNLPWQTMTREVQTQDWEIYRNQHPNKEKEEKINQKRKKRN